MRTFGPTVTLLVAIVAGCTNVPQLPSPSVSRTVAPGVSEIVASLRTFPGWRSEGGVPVGCDAIGVADPVHGLLDGNLEGRPELVWLIDTYDGTGAAVASAGDTFLLQVSRATAAGSFDDPYYASGILLAGPHLDPARAAQTLVYQGCFPRKDPGLNPTP